MKLYENVVIGNFLYGLGFAIGKRVKSDTFPSIVNLLQQTPDDPALGDMLFQAPGLLRVFEFKMRDAYEGKKKEAERQQKLKKHLEPFPDLIPVSREVHWYIEADASKDEFVSGIVPYIDAFQRKTSEQNFTDFIQEIATAAVAERSISSIEAMNRYLSLLATLHKDGVSSGGLVVKMTADGTLHYADLVSITELVLSREQIAAQRIEREAQREQERSRTLELSKGMDYER